MMQTFTLAIEGIAFWAPTLPDWSAARATFRGEAPSLAKPRPLPAPLGLPPGDRRRAPQTVALALHVAEAAVSAAGREASELLAVFTSAHGDLPVIDHLCSTLVHTPRLVSPTRFVHSIHNAPAGVWSMLAHNRQTHSAVSAGEYSFACGLLEAATMAQTEQRPVLLVGYDTAAVGALIHTAPSAGPMALALVISPGALTFEQPALRWQLVPRSPQASPPPSAGAQALAANGMSPALPLLDALASERATVLELPVSEHQSLRIETLLPQPGHPHRPSGNTLHTL